MSPPQAFPPEGGRWHGEAVTDEGASFHRAGLSHRICQGGSAPQGGIHLGTPCRRSRAGQARPCTKTENIPKGRLPAARKAFPPLGGRWHGEAVTDEGASFHRAGLSHRICQGGSALRGGIHLGTPCRRSRAGQARPYAGRGPHRETGGENGVRRSSAPGRCALHRGHAPPGWNPRKTGTRPREIGSGKGWRQSASPNRTSRPPRTCSAPAAWWASPPRRCTAWGPTGWTPLRWAGSFRPRAAPRTTP